MRKVVNFILLILVLQFANAQKIEKYFDFQWRETSSEYAMFYGVWEKVDSLWHRKDYYIHQKSLQMEGFFKDEACKVHHGKFTHYYTNGNVESTSNYQNNSKEGVFISYHPNGMIKDSAFYRNDKMIGMSAAWYPSGNIMYERMLDTMGNQSGIFVDYFDNEKISYKGRWGKDFIKTGTWTYYHNNGNKAQNVVYVNDTSKQVICYDTSGVQQETCELADTPAQFRGGGGSISLTKYIEKRVYWPSDYKFTNQGKATVTIRFTIDETGKVKNPFVLRGFHPAFDKIALQIFIGMPNWSPAIHHNRTVEQNFIQSISFTSPE